MATADGSPSLAAPLRRFADPARAPAAGRADASGRDAQRKAHVAGTHRVVDPGTTLARVRPLLPRLGATRLADVTGLDHLGLPVAMAVRPASRNYSIIQGKGLTRVAALASAAMEAVESHACEHPPPGVVTATVAALGGDALLPRHWLRRRLPPAARLRWAPGRDLLSGRRRYVPLDLAVSDFTEAARGPGRPFRSTTNGTASGNTHDEAVLHALCELIERDAFAMWSLRPRAARDATELDLAGVDDRLCRRTLDALRRAGVAVRAWDLEAESRVAAFFAVIDDAPGARRPFLGPFGGKGCHPSPAVALLRAIHEAAQSRMALIVGAREDLTAFDYAAIGWRGHAASLAMAPRRGRGRRFPARLAFDTPTIDGDLGRLLERLAGAGPLVAIDMTRPEIGVPAVRVVAPGLEGMIDKPGYRPGARARARLRGAA